MIEAHLTWTCSAEGCGAVIRRPIELPTNGPWPPPEGWTVYGFDAVYCPRHVVSFQVTTRTSEPIEKKEQAPWIAGENLALGDLLVVPLEGGFVYSATTVVGLTK